MAGAGARGKRDFQNTFSVYQSLGAGLGVPQTLPTPASAHLAPRASLRPSPGACPAATSPPTPSPPCAFTPPGLSCPVPVVSSIHRGCIQQLTPLSERLQSSLTNLSFPAASGIFLLQPSGSRASLPRCAVGAIRKGPSLPPGDGLAFLTHKALSYQVSPCALCYFPFYRCGIRGTEREGPSPQVTQPARGKVEAGRAGFRL